MIGSAAALRAKLAAPQPEIARVTAGIGCLHDLYRELIRAYAPPNPQFERERIIAQAANPRQFVFVLGLLSEGENEAALLLDLMCAVETAEPGSPIDHLVDEAWYYLRTSIDETWQLDDGPPSASAALVYLFSVLSERLTTLRSLPPTAPLAAAQAPERTALLRSLRDEFSATTASDPNDVARLDLAPQEQLYR
jgi:hypothetical protein